MLSRIDLAFEKVTMYRLMLYYLRLLVIAAIVLSFLGFLPYRWFDIVLTAVYLVIVCYAANRIMAALFHVKPNYESPIITALILTLILGPVHLWSGLSLLTLSAIASMVSKYLLVRQKRHIVNPAAFGALITALVMGQAASWWVGSFALLPFVLLGGLAVLRKIGRFHLVISFLLTYFALLFAGVIFPWPGPAVIMTVFKNVLFFSPLLFFVLVMLVEPLTAPADRTSRIYYGITVGIFLFVLQKTLNVPYTLELALLSGNLLVRIVNPNFRAFLRLVRTEKLSSGIMSFWFEPARKFVFNAGQFLEYTLPHPHTDNRGMRRYFTIASSPTEDLTLLTTRFFPQSSSFKTALRTLRPGREITIFSPEGDFVLPADEKQPLVFIAGGIGITPFRSMIKYLLDENQPRPVTLLYSARAPEDFAFRELFDEAKTKLGLKVVYTVTNQQIGSSWEGRIGLIDENLIRDSVSDLENSLFYVSGPQPMVEEFRKMLANMGIIQAKIKTDYFPGYTDREDYEDYNMPKKK